MVALKVLSLFFLTGILSSEDGSLFRSCAVEDTECFSKNYETFLKNTATGVPEYDIKPIDPMFLDMVCVSGSKDIMFHFKNITVTGLTNMKIKDFKMDTVAKALELSTKEDLDITATLIVELTDVSKTFTGSYDAKVHAIGTTKYNYEIITDDKGVEHFEIGPETVTCDIPDDPKVSLGRELESALDNDADAKNKKDDYLAHRSETRKHAICKIIEVAFHVLVHNIRAAVKIFPKTAFFTNA